MRTMLKSWRFRIGVLVVSGMVLYATAYTLLPRTADGISVTVLHCATVQFEPADDCPGTTIFHRTFTDEATVSGVLTTLNRMHYYSLFDQVFSDPFVSNGGWTQNYVYRIGLLWHGVLVKSYTAGLLWRWDVTTLGNGLQWASAFYPLTTGQDLARLTGLPVPPDR